MFFSAHLFINRLVNKNLFSLHLTTPVFYALESGFILLLGPLFAKMWHQLNHDQCNPQSINKFILAIFCAGCAFMILGISTSFSNTQGLVSALWMIIAYFFITIGELLIAPIGLSAVTLSAPPNRVDWKKHNPRVSQVVVMNGDQVS